MNQLVLSHGLDKYMKLCLFIIYQNKIVAFYEEHGNVHTYLGAQNNSDLHSIFCIMMIRNYIHHYGSWIVMPMFKFTLWQMEVIGEGGLQELLASSGLRKYGIIGLENTANSCQPRVGNLWLSSLYFSWNKKFSFGYNVYKVPVRFWWTCWYCQMLREEGISGDTN